MSQQTGSQSTGSQTAKLDALFQEVDAVVLSRQHPLTGLLPASTAVNNHGDYTDAWVRDNVYSIICVWALGLAYRKNNGDEARADLLEQATIKLMRGLLQSMMRQSHKVERFKNTLDRNDSLHAKYSTVTGLEVVGDYDWGHLQIDATSLYLLMLAQMSASGLRIVKTLGEVNFIQNLVYYIGSAYRIPDFGIWERGNKINNGNPEINASSVGMAKAALHALDGFNVFGKNADPRAIIHSVPDSVALARSTLASLLPRESLSKEVDAALLSIIGFPAFAIGDIALVEKTRQEILSKLAGKYGCKRFLLDGHQTAIEAHSRIHYERTELANFEHIESEWPLFYTYLYLQALFDGDKQASDEYRKKLESLTVERDGFHLLPELYYLPAEQIAAEKKHPQSQIRVSNDNVPLVWAQSLYVTGRMIDDDLLEPSHLDVLNLRQRTSSQPNTQIALVVLAEDESVKNVLVENSVVAETIEDIAPLQVISAPHLVGAYTMVGANQALGLSGRPRRKLQSLATSQTYSINDQIYLCLSWLQSDEKDYRNMDAELLCEQLSREIEQVLNNWTNKEVAVFTLMVKRELCDTPNVTTLFEALRRLQLRTEYVQLGYASAALAYRASRVNKLIIPNVRLSPLSESNKSPINLENAHLPDELIDIVDEWCDSRSQFESYAILSRYLEGKSLDSEVGDFQKKLTLRELIESLYDQAKSKHAWVLVRYCYGLLGYTQMELTDVLTMLVARDLSVELNGRQRHSINQQLNNDEIARLIQEVSADPLEGVLMQEVLTAIGRLIRTEPEIFYGLRTIQLDNLLRLCSSDETQSCTTWQAMAELSPASLFHQVRDIFVAQKEKFSQGLGMAALIRLGRRSTEADSPTPVDTDWLEWRVARGSVTRFENEFLQSIWKSLAHAKTIVFVDQDSADTVLDCELVRSSTTAGEEAFAQIIDGFAQQLHPAYYRAVLIEVLYGFTEYCAENPTVFFEQPVVLAELLEKTADVCVAKNQPKLPEQEHLGYLVRQAPHVLQDYLKEVFKPKNLS